MTDDQKRMSKALSRCTFQPGSHAKRFVRDLGDGQELTPRWQPLAVGVLLCAVPLVCVVAVVALGGVLA